MRHGYKGKRMPIRHAARHDFRADHAIRPGAIFHRHRLPPGGGQRFSNQPRRDVRNAAWRIGHNHAHRAIGKAALRFGTGSEQDGGRGKCHAAGKLHGVSPFECFAKSI